MKLRSAESFNRGLEQAKLPAGPSYSMNPSIPMQTTANSFYWLVNPKSVFGALILVVLMVPLRLGAQNGTWTNLVNGDASGTWSVSANWLNGLVANGADNTADFSTLPLATNSIVALDTARTLGHLVFGNTATNSPLGTNWILTGSTLTLQTSAGTPTLAANNGTNARWSPGKRFSGSDQIELDCIRWR